MKDGIGAMTFSDISRPTGSHPSWMQILITFQFDGTGIFFRRIFGADIQFAFM